MYDELEIPTRVVRLLWSTYLKPSFLYPAASAYHLASGFTQRSNQGLFMINDVSDGADIVEV